MKMLKPIVGIILGLCAWSTSTVFAQSGDQILDGIGETGLIARYTFEENAKDWSRNNLHGTIEGSEYNFVDDKVFDKVLSLPGDGKAFITIPGEMLAGEESLSISGWVYLRSSEGGAPLFDFGKNGKSSFIATPAATDGFVAQVCTENNTYTASAEAIALNEWNHVVVVINVPTKSFSTYVNGTLVREVKDVDVELKQLFDSRKGAAEQFVIGKSLTSDAASLDAKLHDFRIYRIPLNIRQIGWIHFSARHPEEAEELLRNRQDPDLPEFSESTPQLYNEYLTSVPTVEVETEVGFLPRLPRFVKGVYSNNFQGPDVRVLWPAPEDNKEVLSAGKYAVTGRVAGTDIQPKAIVTVVEHDHDHTAPHRTLEAFDLNEVELTEDVHDHETKFVENRDKFVDGLLETNPDAFLYMFRNAFGQEQPAGAEPLGVWDSQETKLRGHATGHYLSALAQAYSSAAYDPAIQAKLAGKMEYMVNTLYELSQLSGTPKTTGEESVADPLAVPPGPGKAGFDSDLTETGIRTDYWNWGKGFISAYPPDQFIMLEHGAKYGTDNDKVWAPYYTLHKILAGLMDIYEVSGNEKALDIVEGMGDWVHARLSVLPTETLISIWNTYIAGEFGGMNEALARLSRLTDDKNYLETAKLFDNIRVFFGDADHSHGLAKNVDMFRGLHANQHIPQIMGALEIYRDSQEPEYFDIADNFWNKATGDYMYSIGGVAGARNPANAECFTAEPATLYENGFAVGGQNETCATYNMLKLSRNLFLYNQQAELMDYYERGLYNHILASVAEDSPANTYHVPLRAGSVKQFSNAHMDGFTCCNGTALESNTKLQNSIYFKSADNDALYVNLYVPSTLKWTDKNVTVTQTTAYPKEDNTTLTINGSGKFDLNVRVPHWATDGFYVTVNGKKEEVKAEPGTYLAISRKWKDGDKVELRMPFRFYLEPVMDQQNVASLFYGPVLLAAQEEGPRKEWRKVTLDAEDISKSISGDPEKLEFEIDGVVYKPFYETYGRHSVYLDVILK
ncbi:glycoside hydrolase family 127 protein [Draconibacterium sp. IB214405]|uniref:beta-L-arabinofuranosidase domain-containing protein n=1 Tax=Draconibacterium sp. IB214405 TaxID=3097352 RepID=UPI002A17FAE8|nr:beta-L-arabinofuranosidase domain-containing protein [Draconibacterium sp. IB214405]MDX8339129.1 glycoside hydrolase family 127 protein [Draconibacterium sp. IB214405]